MNETYTLKNGMTLTDENQVGIFTKLIELQPHFNIKFPHNEIGLGNLFAECFKHSQRFCVDNQQWYIYKNGVWRLDKGEIKTQENMQVLLTMLSWYCDEIKTDENQEIVDKYAKFIHKSSTDVVLRRCINTSKNMMIIELSEFDSNPYLLNTTNGVYDLRTGERMESKPELYLTKKTNTYPAHALTKPCERWYQFIDEIMSHDKEKAAFLQRALGYSIFGVNREECMFLAYGAKTRNGKGTLMSTLQKALSSGYMESVDTDLICVDKRGKIKDFNAPQPALRKIVGSRIVTMSENERDVLLASAAVKSITGRDELTTRGLHENPISFVPQFKMWLSTNYLPAVNDDTVFKSDRIWVIEFNETFVSKDKRDDKLKEFFEKPENLPTILKWLMDGCKDYLENGLNPPECVVKATKAYRDAYDRVGTFIRECCELGEGKKVIRGNLSAAYERWCRKPENRFTPLGSQKFFNEMQLRGFSISKIQGDYYFKGIELLPMTTGVIPLF